MEIDLNPIPRPARSTQSTASRDPGGELLRAIARAGRVEAEVLQRLPGELLLDTRFGRFRIDSKHAFQPGDKLSLRLETRGASQVLRAAPARAEPLSLPLTNAPSLARLLGATDLVLAELRSSSGGQSELRTGDRLFRLPLELPRSEDRLFLFRRVRDGAAVEIEKVSRSDVLRATLLQLLPRDGADAEPVLPRLLQWATSLARGNLPGPPTPASPSGDARRTSAPAGPARTSSAGRDADAATLRPEAPGRPRSNPQPAPDFTRRTDIASAPPRTLPTQVPAAVRGPARPQSASGPAAAAAAAGAAPMRPANGIAHGSDSGKDSDARLPAAGPTRNDAGKSAPGTAQSLPASRTTDNPVPSRPQSGPGAPVPATATTGTSPAAEGASTPRGEFSVPGRSAAPGARAAATSISSASAAPTAPIAASQTAAANPAVPSPTLAATARQWLQDLPRLPDVEAGQLRRWLASAHRPRLTAGFAAPAAVATLATLRQTIQREMTLLAEPGAQARAVSPLAAARSEAGIAARPQYDEPLPAWLRDGARLVEQAIGQNLLQRVTTALQAETQQSLVLNLVLPFLDAAEARPLIIEIEQQASESEDAAARWEFRLRFELGGLGPICCQLRLQGQRLGASFFSEWPTTHAVIDSALPELRRQLDRAGFATDELASYAAAPPARESAEQWRFLESMIDLRA